MALITATRVHAGPHAYVYSWTLASATSDTAVPVAIPGAADKTIQVVGTFGGGTVTFAGNNDGTTNVTLNDVSGAALSFTSAGMKVVLENPLNVLPVLTGGSGTSVTIVLCARITE